MRRPEDPRIPALQSGEYVKEVVRQRSTKRLLKKIRLWPSQLHAPVAGLAGGPQPPQLCH